MEIKDMTSYDRIIFFREKLKERLGEKRFIHSLGVQYTAASLAMRYNPLPDFIEKAMYAGLLHDNAKEISGVESIRLCHEYGIEVTDFEAANPFLLHGKLGAYYANTEFAVDDEDILNSITWHTTGRPDMSLLEKIIFTADYIEPQRNKQKNLEAVRQLAFTDLDKCVLKICEDTLDYLKGSQAQLDEMTERTFEYYKRRTK